MNFLLLRSNSKTVAQDEISIDESQAEKEDASDKSATLGGLIGKDHSEVIFSETLFDIGGSIDEYALMENSRGCSNSYPDSHMDLKDDNELVIISCKKVPNSWSEATDMLSYKSLDRSFVFPGERIEVLACFRGPTQDTEIITPFKVASMMNEKRMGKHPERNEEFRAETSSGMQASSEKTSHQAPLDRDAMMEGQGNTDKDVAAAQSFIRLEDQRNRTEKLLQAIKRSHFFAQIVETDGDIWGKRSQFSGSFERKLTGENAKIQKKNNAINSRIDGGGFNGRTSGGLAREAIECCSLSNGDIVVLLQVNVGVEFLSDAVLEIVQFENHHEENRDLMSHHVVSLLNYDPSRDLLKWLLPLDNPYPPSARPKSPPVLSSFSSIRGTSTKSNVPGSSGTQILSHFRSYSMSSLPQATEFTATTAKQTSFDPGDWNQFSFKRLAKMGKSRNAGLLSFRGMPLEPRRFSARCGLEGVFTYARSWRKRIQLIRPLEIRSFSSDCNTSDLICVQVKNVCPEIAPDIVMFIDSICLIVEEPPNGVPTTSLPLASTEVGNDSSLPNLMLRRGEEHCFILKPAAISCKHALSRTASILKPEHRSGVSSSRLSSSSLGTQDGSMTYQYSVVVSCHCNYTESTLLFKQPTSWRPRIPKDLLIAVRSEQSKLILGPDGTELPIQVLNLEVSNRTLEDLTMTFIERVHNEQKVGDSPSDNGVLSPEFDVSNGGHGCTHLCLRSNIPLGSVPSHSMTAVKLEVLPLLNGIITLDSLQIDVKEKGFCYIPENTLKIDATSGFSSSR